MSDTSDTQRTLRSQLRSPPVSDELLQQVRVTLANIGSTIQDLNTTAEHFDHHFDQLAQQDADISRQAAVAEFRADARVLERRLSNPNSLVRNRIALFESRSTGNLASGHRDFTANLPTLERPPSSPLRVTMPNSIEDMEEVDPGSGTEGGDGDGDLFSTTPNWDNFYAKMRNILEHTKAQTEATETKLSGDHTQADLRALKTRMEMLQSRFVQYEDQYNNITAEEYVEDDANLYRDIQGALDCIVSLAVNINIELDLLQPTPPPTKVGNSGAATLAAFMKVANSPPVELPTFDGRKISDYAPFKEKFNFVIQYIAGPKELWATHLESKLIGEAKKYIGLKGSWYNKYDELWEALDDKYANRWNIATEAVRNFFFKHRPEDNQESVLNWFHEQIDNLRNIINLKMSVEEIGTNLILQTLPDNYAREVRSGLRVAHAGNKKKAAFSIKELRTVVNDTIAIKHEPESFSPPKSTLSLQTAATSTGTGGTAGTPQGLQPLSQSNGGGRGRSRGGRSRGGRSRGGYGRGHGRANFTKTRKCVLCDSVDHWANLCKDPRYRLATERRKKMMEKNLCIACGRDNHPNVKCSNDVTCAFEGHYEQPHFSWLCGGQVHPGIQA